MIDSVYAVFFQHVFIPELFFGDFSKLNPAFHFLNRECCVEDLIYAGQSDFKLTHQQFWRHTIEGYRLPNQDDRLLNLFDRHGLKRRTDHLEFSLPDTPLPASLVADLVNLFHPTIPALRQPFIKNLGPLYVSRAALPFRQRKDAFRFLRNGGLGYDFGSVGTEDSREAHIPISVKIRKKCDISSRSRSLGSIELSSSARVLDVKCRPRIHLFPYGLTTAYLLVNFRSRHDTVTWMDYVEAMRKLSSSDGSLVFTFSGEEFSSMSALMRYLLTQVTESLYTGKPLGIPSPSRLYSLVTLNISQHDGLKKSEILKMMALDPTQSAYSPSFLRTHSSILGKYKGDFVFCSTERMMMSLSVQWQNYRKKKTRVRYYWLFIHLFQFVSGIKYLGSTLAGIIDEQPPRERSSPMCSRIAKWIRFSNTQHIRVNPIYRKVFYKLYDRLEIKKTLATLAKEIRMGIRSSTSVTIEEIDEFKEVRTVTRQQVQKDWLSYMGIASEQSIKTMICEILGDIPRNDWGGELSDHFTTIHVGGKAYQAAFLFKGPSRFHEMKPSDLGKNADQIFRLTATPCDIMVIQHCHAIGEAVRATADAFASVPDHSRKYCLVDGIDTFRLLKAYCKI